MNNILAEYSTCESCGGKGFTHSPPVAPNRLPVCHGCRECLGSGVVQNYITLQSLEDDVPDSTGRVIRATVNEQYSIARCPKCSGVMSCSLDHQLRHTGDSWCENCLPRDTEGRLIRAATDVARAQRKKGIGKYGVPLEDQTGYTIVGMIDMAGEELADGSVYVQKAREQVVALLQELENAIDMNNAHASLTAINNIICREKGNA